MINARETLTGTINIGISYVDLEIEEYYFKNDMLTIKLTNGKKLIIDINEMKGIENMTISINNNDLVFNYDEDSLDFNFTIENGDLIINNNEDDIDFNINENEELEVAY